MPAGKGPIDDARGSGAVIRRRFVCSRSVYTN